MVPLRMCRSTLESVFIVGFYSFCGEVRAAKRWGGEGQVMPLTPAAPGRREGLARHPLNP